MVGVDEVDPFLQFWVLQTLLDGFAEEADVGIQGELVHGVDPPHVSHHEEQDGGALSTGSIALGRCGHREKVVGTWWGVSASVNNCMWVG